MAKTSKTPPSTSSNRPTNRPTSRREALRREQEAAARSKRVVKVAWVTGIGIIAVLVAVMVWSLVRSGGTAGTATGSVVTPSRATTDGAIVLGNPTAKVAVAVYADFMCPYCGQFERANGNDLAGAVTSGTAKVEYHPMAFLDDHSSGTLYSTRSANAFVTVAEADPNAALAFNRLLFENQPAEGSSGLTDERLIELAKQAGASDATTAAFAAQTYVPWIKQATQQAFDSGITGTPSVKINGEAFKGDLFTAGPLATAISQAANG